MTDLGCRDIAVAEAYFAPMDARNIDAVVQAEQSVHAHPWSRRHFEDVVNSGYQAQVLLGDTTLLAYFVAMPGVGEVHLLNITVVPAFQRQGWARVLLDALVVWARGQGAQSIWLEVRQSNERAIQVYEKHGFRGVGLRRDYYPAAAGQRENALVMCRMLDTPEATA